MTLGGAANFLIHVLYAYLNPNPSLQVAVEQLLNGYLQATPEVSAPQTHIEMLKYIER
jgi:hypothetical protein